MKSIFQAATLLCLLSAGAVAQTNPSRKPGSVEGTVRNSATGAAIRKATITLRSPGNTYVARSDADGRFRFDTVESGTHYSLTADCPGFVSDSQADVAVAEEHAVTSFSVKLVPLGSISGKVVDEDGEGLPGVDVMALRIAYQGGRKRVLRLGSTRTDDRGGYRIFDLPAGRYYVLVRPDAPNSHVRTHSDPPEQRYPAVFYPGVADTASASVVEMVPGAEAPGLDFHLKRVPVFHIRGIVRDQQSHQPVGDTTLAALSCDLGLDLFSAIVNLPPNGTFDIAAMPGRYCLSVQHGIFAWQPVTVADQDISGLVLSASPTVSVPGTLTTEGAPSAGTGATIVLASAAGDSFGSDARVLPDHSFVLQNVPPVTSEIKSISLPREYYVKTIQYGDRDVPDGRFTVTPGSSLKLVAATDTGQLAVAVRRVDGTPAAAIAVTIAPVNGRRDWLRNVTTAANGIAAVPGLPPGDYKVFAWERIEPGLADVPEFRQWLEARATSVTISPNATASVPAQLIPVDAIDDALHKLP